MLLVLMPLHVACVLKYWPTFASATSFLSAARPVRVGLLHSSPVLTMVSDRDQGSEQSVEDVEETN